MNKCEFVDAVIRIAAKRFKLEINARNQRPQIDFGHKKLHAGHLEALYPAILAPGVHLPTLIEKVAPGRSCVHKPMREILQELHREQAEQAHIRDAREDAHG